MSTMLTMPEITCNYHCNYRRLKSHVKAIDNAAEVPRDLVRHLRGRLRNTTIRVERIERLKVERLDLSSIPITTVLVLRDAVPETTRWGPDIIISPGSKFMLREVVHTKERQH